MSWQGLPETAVEAQLLATCRLQAWLQVMEMELVTRWQGRQQAGYDRPACLVANLKAYSTHRAAQTVGLSLH